MAKKLAEKVVRISIKQNKTLKKVKKSPQPVVDAKMPEKHKIKPGLMEWTEQKGSHFS